MDRDRTTIPRTRPRFRTISCPGRSNVVLTMWRDTNAPDVANEYPHDEQKLAASSFQTHICYIASFVDSHSLSTSGSLARRRSNEPKGRCPAFRAISSCMQSEKPREGCFRKWPRAADTTSESCTVSVL